MIRRAAAAGLLVVLACATGGGGGETGERPPRTVTSRADEWITLRDFRYVTSVSVAQVAAYFGTTAGVERFDTLRDRWLSPVTEADGLPDPYVTALVADPASGDLWIGTRRGLARLTAFSADVEAVWGPPPVPVDLLLMDARQGQVWARVGGLWWTGGAGSPILDRAETAPPAGLRGSADASDLDPAAVPWTDPLHVRSEAVPDRLFRLTGVDRDLRGDWYVGTWGDNGRRWGAGIQDWRPLYYGLAGAGGGPLVRAADGYWFVPGSEDEAELARTAAFASGASRVALEAGGVAPVALAHAGPELDDWSYAVPGLEPGLPLAAGRAAAATGDTLWLGTDAGLVRGAGGEWRTWGLTGPDPIGPVGALAVDAGVVWVGTDDGLVALDRSDARVVGRWLRGRRVLALAAAPDAVFVGTAAAGLWVGTHAAAADSAPALPDSLTRVVARGAGVRALAWRGTTLVVATELGLQTFDRRSGRWSIVDAADGRLGGPPLALAADSTQVWIGTGSGLVRWRPETDEWRVYGPRDGLAGTPVLNLLADGDVVWASTPAGVTRFAWRSAGW